MEKTKTIPEEIIIVGSRYGELADVITPLYNKKAPIDSKDIAQALGDDIAYLSPVPNRHDKYAVGVFNKHQRQIGFVWMYQAPAMRCWLESNNKDYIRVRVKDANPVAHVLMAEPEAPIDISGVNRCCNGLDMQWANDLPEVLRSIYDQSLSLRIGLLYEELSQAREWNRSLKLAIDNVLQYIPSDLSAYRHNEYMGVFNMMRQSEIEEVRQQSYQLLHTLVSRGSEEHVRMWCEKWLPSFFREAANGDLLGIYEAAHYTLERVEGLLDHAPENLFCLYQVNKPRFVRRLYYSALPQEIYNRLLTLLAVREAMLKKPDNGTGKCQTTKAGSGKVNVEKTLSREKLARAIENCQKYFWGNSSYAVLFCVCRDECRMEPNKSAFERMIELLPYTRKRAYNCPAGTLANAFSDNLFYNDRIDKWDAMNVMERVIILRDELKKELEL